MFGETAHFTALAAFTKGEKTARGHLVRFSGWFLLPAAKELRIFEDAQFFWGWGLEVGVWGKGTTGSAGLIDRR
jgi:hypothetical protein